MMRKIKRGFRRSATRCFFFELKPPPVEHVFSTLFFAIFCIPPLYCSYLYLYAAFGGKRDLPAIASRITLSKKNILQPKIARFFSFPTVLLNAPQGLHSMHTHAYPASRSAVFRLFWFFVAECFFHRFFAIFFDASDPAFCPTTGKASRTPASRLKF